MYEYRITKYNPKLRRLDGSYSIQNEWTSVYDCQDTETMKDEYLRVERLYIQTLVEILNFQTDDTFQIDDIEVHTNSINSTVLSHDLKDHFLKFSKLTQQTTILSLAEFSIVVKLILRELMWARLQYKESFIHFGYDFYCYVGLQFPIAKSLIDKYHKLGIYIEKFDSPYNELN